MVPRLSSLVIADIWHELCHTSIKEAHLEEKEKSEKGFKRFMLALSSLVVSKEHQPHDDSIQNLPALSGRQRVVVPQIIAFLHGIGVGKEHVHYGMARRSSNADLTSRTIDDDN